MGAFFLCVYVFCEHSLDSLREVLKGHDCGTLLYAIKITGISHAEAQEIVRRNWLVAVSQYRSEFPCLNMQPFVKKIEIDDNVFEYHASCIDLFSIDAAYKLWNQLDIAVAQAAYNRWLRSSDASLENPVNRECAMLQRCIEELSFVTESKIKEIAVPKSNIITIKQKRKQDKLKKIAD
jgi:hypothetical protein